MRTLLVAAIIGFAAILAPKANDNKQSAVNIDRIKTDSVNLYPYDHLLARAWFVEANNWQLGAIN